MSIIIEAVTRHASAHRNAIAVSDDRVSLTYESLFQETEEWSATLASLLRPTLTVGSCLDNCAVWVLLELALVKLGLPTVPVPLFFTDAQRRHALAQAGASVLLADRPMAEYANPIELRVRERTLYLHPLESAPVKLPTRTAKVTYTSGTTGNCKGVCLSQAGLEAVANGLVEVIGQEYSEVHCAVLPLTVLLENVAGLYTTLLAGGHYHVPRLATVGFAQAFSPDFGVLARALRECGATSTILVPELLRGLVAALPNGRTSLPEMNFLAVGGARISHSLLEQASTLLHLPVFQGYGLSESASVVAVNTPAHNRLGSVGKVLPGVGLEISADGEIVLNSPASLGYIGDRLSPRRFATGDIGHVDGDGYLYIDGRKSNVLITGFGRNIAPEWVESELLSHRSLAQAMVFGEATPALGALLVPTSVSVTDDDLGRAIEQANRRLPEYAQVRHWTRVPPFTAASDELTGNGRLRRTVIERNHQKAMSACQRQPGLYISFFESLIRATSTARSTFLTTPQIREGLAGRISRSTYLHYLAEAYHHVKHTVPLMRLTDKSLLPRQTWLHEALGRYISEETGHEEWILEDIAHAGGDAEAVRNATPGFSTELMVSYAYDFIGRVNPVGFLGMVFVLESTSEQLASRGAHALMHSLNLPENCFRYLVSHGAVDIDHMRFFKDLMYRIDDRRDQTAVIHMAKAIYRLYGDVFASIPHVEDITRVA